MTTAPAYAEVGVDQDQANAATRAIVDVLRHLPVGRPSREVLGSGHFASVLRLTERLGIALSTDGVGTKLLIAEELGRLDTVGIDCVAMNVNDVLCVGARPIAMLDYIAIEEATPEKTRAIGEGLYEGAKQADIEIPGGEIAQVGEIVKGLDLVGACIGVVDLNRIVSGTAIEPGDSIIGLPSSGLHANGYTLARRALKGISWSDESLGAPLGDVLLRPTKIYVRPVLELLESRLAVHGLAHITSDGLDNLRRLNPEVGYEIDDELPVPLIFELIRERWGVSEAEMYNVFNMGCGFCCIVSPEAETQALRLLQGHYPEAKRIGSVVAEPGVRRL